MRGRSVQPQMFYIFMLWNHKGMSRSGLEIMNRLGVGMSMRGFDNGIMSELARQETVIK